MIKGNRQGISFYQSELLLKKGITHYFFTGQVRTGNGGFQSFNLSYLCADAPQEVEKNLSLLKNTFDIPELVVLRQIHSDIVIDLDSEPGENPGYQKREGDALLTRRKNLALGVLTADCYPLIIAEPEEKIIAIAHCGRAGILKGIVENTLKAFFKKGGKRKSTSIALGPGICSRHYQVDEEIIEQVKFSYPDYFSEVCWKENQTWLLDLESLILKVLLSSGIPRENIETSKLCTYESKEFFSYRREDKTGRQLSLVMLK